MCDIRFTKDNLLSVKSNIDNVNSILKKYDCEQYIKQEAARLIKKWGNKSNKIPNNTALLIGQLPTDRSIIDIKQGTFTSLLTKENKLQIERIAKNYNHVLFLKHPLLQITSISYINCKKYLSTYKNIQILNYHNCYKLMTHKNIDCVYGLSSSVLSEAKYFNKPTKYLYEPFFTNYYRIRFDILSNLLNSYIKDNTINNIIVSNKQSKISKSVFTQNFIKKNNTNILNKIQELLHEYFK